MTRAFRQGELLKQADEWLKQGYTILIQPDGVKVLPKGKEVPKDDLSDVRFDK